MSQPISRRTLLHTSALSLGAAAVAGLPRVASAHDGEHDAADHKGETLSLKQGDVVLFQGDSITDAGRNRGREDQANDAKMLGDGYPFLLAGGLLQDHADLGLRVYNRGISGNKVPDLQARWQKDYIDLKPALVSILIGVNDMWRTKDSDYAGTPETYRQEFSDLLTQTREALPETRIVVCEPFVTRTGKIDDGWFPEIDVRREKAAAVAKEHGAIWVPFQSMFNDAIAAGTSPAYWCGDGVHPSVAGHALMAKTWRKHVGI